jgi:PKD repeat protein
MKRKLFIAASFALLSVGLMAQGARKLGPPAQGSKNFSQQNQAVEKQDFSTPNLKSGQLPSRGCGTAIPGKEWDEAFNKMVNDHQQALMTGKATSSTYTIPIVFHIIHSSSEAVGSGHNVSQAQVNSQIPILNADYGGTGVNTNLYAAMTYSGQPAFYQYAAAPTNSVSAASKASNGSIAIANSGITFCLATKNPSGTVLAEPGIDRVSWQSISGATDPATSSNLNSLMDGTIKPATIWDPTKYFNVWVSDGGTSGLLGYATFPPASTSSAITPAWGETVSNVSTTDGVWMAYNALGNTGAAASPYNLGRTLTHESGHWLGLRHIWGDGSCVTDYCNDTPPASGANYVNCGTAYPYHSGTCTGNSPDGEMYMNFMDYSNDCGMWMFTTDQVNRFHSALSLSPWRSGLTASATNLCNATVSTPTAAFSFPSSLCMNTAEQFTDGSSGPPTSWSWSVTPSATITTSTSQSPMITFPAAGTYTVSLTATNSAGSNSISHTVTVSSCTVAVTCPDTLTNFKTTDSLTILRSTAGFVSGNNNYGDLAKGEYYSGTGLPASPKVTGGIFLYYRNAATNQGTKGTATLTLSMYNATNVISGGGGPQGAALATHTVSLSTITALTPVTGVPYCGNPSLGFSTAIIYPYDFNFTSPINITGGFVLATSLPPNGTDTVALFMTSGNTATGSTAWEKQSSGTWYPFNDGLGTSGSTWAINSSLAILPKINCTTGVNDPDGISNHMALFPNPSNGLFNIATTLPVAADLTFTVVNTLGQTVYVKQEKNVTNSIITLDLSDKAKGVYYVNIVSEKSSVILKAVVK